MEAAGIALLIGCVALIGTVLLSNFFEHLGDLLRKATVTLSVLVVIVVLVVQTTPLQFGRFEQRFSKVARQVATAVHAANHR